MEDFVFLFPCWPRQQADCTRGGISLAHLPTRCPQGYSERRSVEMLMLSDMAGLASGQEAHLKEFILI